MSLQLSICFNFLISFPCTMFILFFEIDLNNLIVLFIIYLFNSKYILPISSFSHPTILFFFSFLFRFTMDIQPLSIGFFSSVLAI